MTDVQLPSWFTKFKSGELYAVFFTLYNYTEDELSRSGKFPVEVFTLGEDEIIEIDGFDDNRYPRSDFTPCNPENEVVYAANEDYDSVVYLAEDKRELNRVLERFAEEVMAEAKQEAEHLLAGRLPA